MDFEQSQKKLGVEKKDLSHMHARIASVVRAVSKKPDLHVTTDVDPIAARQLQMQGKDPETVWFKREFIDKKTGLSNGEYVHIPKQIIEEDEDVALGSAAHEAGHVIISRARVFIPDEVLRKPGFSAIFASVEERPTDQVVRDRFPGGGEWVDAMRKSLGKEGAVIRQQLEVMGRSASKLPKFQQFCDLLVFEPHFADVSKEADSDVIESYNRVRQSVEKAEHTLPKEEDGEEEILKCAQRRYAITYKKIFGEAEALLKIDEAQRKIDGMLQEKGQTILEKLNDEQKKELKEMLKKMFKQMITPKPELGDEETPEFDFENDEIPTIPIDLMSDALQEALKEAFDALPKGLKEKIIEKAREDQRKMEDQIIKQFTGGLEDAPLETHNEWEHRIRQEKEEEKKLKKQQEKKEANERKKEEEDAEIRQKLQEIDRKEAEMSSNVGRYDAAYSQVHTFDEQLFRELEEVFKPNVKRNMHLRTSGAKINLPAVFKWTAARKAGSKTVDMRIFEHTHIPEKKDYAFTFLVDLSGSMGGVKLQETFKALVLLCEVLNRLGVKFEILGFKDSIMEFKKFDEPFDDIIRQKISGMWAGGGNDDAPCVLAASDRLAKQTAREKFLCVFSDGQPVGRDNPVQDLHDAIHLVLTQTDQKLVGLGLGPDTEHVGTFYPTSLPNIRILELVEKIGGLLKDMIINPQKYTYKNNG